VDLTRPAVYTSATRDPTGAPMMDRREIVLAASTTAAAEISA
jgi:hypothetical protein